MSKLARAGVVGVASVLAVPLWAVPAAFAATSSEAASDGAYFYREGLSKPEQAPAAPPNVTGEADGVPKGHLAVAAQGGQEDKVSFLRFPLADVPFDATLTKAVLTVPLTPSGNGTVVISADPAKVRACRAGDTGFSGDDAANLALAPERLCEEFAAPAKASADGKAYEFDITGLAATWLEANDGVALTAAEGAASTPFQIVFQPFSEARLSYEYTEAAPLPTVPDTDTSVGGGFSGDTGSSFDGGFAGDAGSSFDGGGFVDAPVIDPGTVPAPEPMAAPEAPEPAVAGTPIRNVALTDAAPLTPSGAFWLGALAVGALLALLSLILGDPRVASPAARRTSRLSQALEQRERSAAGGVRVGRPLSI